MRLRCNCLNFYSLFIGLVTLVSYSDQTWRLDDEGCITPTGETGNCIPARRCSALLKALSAVKKPLSEKVHQQLERYFCSITKETYKVCCPYGPIVFEEEKPAMNEFVVKTDLPKDISTHHNYHLLPTDCGYIDLGKLRVIHGQNADLTDFPWMALLSSRGIDNRAHFTCGGTIINTRYILTAAHCLEQKSKLLGVRVGEYDTSNKIDCNVFGCNDPVQDLAVEEIIVHPNYRSKGKVNDIALLRVTPIRLNEKNIRPVCLPRDRNKDIESEYVEVSGWGARQHFSNRQSQILQKAFLRVVSTTECKEIYKNYTDIDIDNTRICAGGGVNGTYACSGDSGGPIQEKVQYNGVRYVQHGIVSFGKNGCVAPEVFTKVAHYMHWILDNLKP